jgi:hypothetical protein
MEPNWVDWAKRLNAIAQNGLTFAQNSFDVERYKAVRRIAAEILADGSGVDVHRVLDLLSHDTGYATPKVDVRAAIFRNDALLLVKERDDGCWTLPGGWADVGEAPSENIAREVAEECGDQVRVVKLPTCIVRRALTVNGSCIIKAGRAVTSRANSWRRRPQPTS